MEPSEPSRARMSLMRSVLDGLVPLFMALMERRGIPSDERIAACADVITANGDDLEHGRDGAQMALNALAEAIATLAMIRPEGINLLGGHWCRDHRVCGSAA